MNRRILMKFIGGVGCVTSYKILDFGVDPDHNADKEFKKEFYHYWTGTIMYKFCDKSRSCRRIFTKFFQRVGCLTSNKTFDLEFWSASWSESWIFTPASYKGIAKNLRDQLLWQRFAGSVCLWLLLLIPSNKCLRCCRNIHRAPDAYDNFV